MLPPIGERRFAMPVYEYLCNDCQHSFEKILTLSEHEHEPVKCPKCESENVVQEPARFFAFTDKKSA